MQKVGCGHWIQTCVRALGLWKGTSTFLVRVGLTVVKSPTQYQFRVSAQDWQEPVSFLPSLSVPPLLQLTFHISAEAERVTRMGYSKDQLLVRLQVRASSRVFPFDLGLNLRRLLLFVVSESFVARLDWDLDCTGRAKIFFFFCPLSWWPKPIS